MKTQLFYKNNEIVYKKIPRDMWGLVYGNKGAHLLELQEIGSINVPKFVILPTNFCRLYNEDEEKATLYLVEVLKKIVPFFEGSLVSVRSGAPYSMPGLMETVLNVGIMATNFPHLISRIGERGAFNSLFRLRKMFGEIVLGQTYTTEYEEYDPTGSLLKIKQEYKDQNQTTPETLDLGSQLFYCVKAVWDSWDSENAQGYRKFNHLTNTGTAVVIQEMVFGNTHTGATGVMFSSNIDEATSVIQGEYLPFAQGEDIVSGKVTPRNIDELKNDAVYARLTALASRLQDHYKWPQDIEWTLEDKSTIYTLQTRDAKIPAQSRIEFCYKNLKQETNVPLKHLTLDDFLLPCERVVPNNLEEYFIGTSASNGVIVGTLTFDIEKCSASTIFCAPYTTVDVVPALMKCGGIVALEGGTTSHAVVIARSLSKPCLIGLQNAKVLYDMGGAPYLSNSGSFIFKEGDDVCLDSTNGKLYRGTGVIKVDTVLQKKIKYIWKKIYQTISNTIVMYDSNPQLYNEMFPDVLFLTQYCVPLNEKKLLKKKLFYGHEEPISFYKKFHGQGEGYISYIHKYFKRLGATYLEDCSQVMDLNHVLYLFKKEKGYI